MDSATSDSNGVIITGDLDRRPSRAPGYQAEANALNALAEAMSTNPDKMLQLLVEVAMELTRSDSAGISLLEPGGENGTFYWVATAGAWSPYQNGTMAREVSPCGEVAAREAVLLMKNPERLFPALFQAAPGISEALLAPFHLDGVPVGTVWTIKHRPDDHFDAEDARVLKNLARFASAGHQTIQALQLAKAAGQQAGLRVQQLVSLAEVSNDFFGTCDMEYMPIYGNAAAMRMVGLADLDEVKRTPLHEFFFPEDLAFITDEFFPRVLREGQAKVEIRFRHFVTAEPVWVDYGVVVLKDEMGQATGLGTVTHDLTERKRAEAALRDSEARLSRILRQSPAGIVQTDADGMIVLCNNRWCDMLGYSESEMLGMSAIELTHPSSVDATLETVGRLAKGGADFQIEKNYRRKDGVMLRCSSNVAALRDAQGNYQDLLAVVLDMTKRLDAEDRLRESEAQLKFSLTAASAGMWDWHIPSGKIFWSPENYVLYNMEPVSDGPRYADWDARIHPDDREQANQAVSDVLEGRAAEFKTEFRIVGRDGTIRWLAGLGNLERAEDNSPVRLSGINIDITLRKQHEEHAQLLMAEVNHRAKNLLSVVQAVAQQTANTGDPLTFAARLSDRIGGLAANQDLLVKNLWHGVEIDELVTSQLAHFKDLIGIRIRLNGPGLTVTAAASQAIGMAVHELATNAAKYGALSNSNGQVHVEWQLTASPESQFLMSWRESDGPLVKAPTRKGFGQTVIKRLVEASVDGNVNVDYAEKGFSWHLRTAAGNVVVISGGGGG